MFRSRDCVHSFKHSNIVYNFGASLSRYLYVVYLNIFTFHFRFRDQTHSMWREHILQYQIFVNELMICWAPNNQAWSCQSSLIILDLWSAISDSCSSCWMQVCQVHVFFKCLYWNILHSTYDTTFMDFYMNCSLLVEWPAQLNPSSWVLNIFKKRLKTHLFHLHFTL